MKVAIIMGSTSDLEIMSQAINVLEGFGVEVVKRVISAHRTPDLMCEFAKSAKDIEKFMREIVEKADKAIKKRVEEDPETKGMGTTLIFAWVIGNKAYLTWCGDSRGYIFNPNSGLKRISRDHSYVQELVDAGKLDAELAKAMEAERERQNSHIELIASENWVSEAVMEAMGSILTNKYAEGYPNARYYGGCEVVDKVEMLAIERVCKLFNCKYANVQPHSGSQANMAVYMSVLEVGDTVEFKIRIRKTVP